jgi:hypothetical protein
VQFQVELNESLLAVVAVATSVMIFVLPIYYLWMLVASFRHELIPRWPPAVCLSLWLLQWPFLILSAVGCMAGGCGDAVRNWLELVGSLAYNSIPAYWLWRRSAAKSRIR